MTFVVTENCIRCLHTDCVDVCPVDCFHEGEHMLVINPEECIDCNLCVPECPVDAIFSEDDLPEDQQDFLAYNEKMSQHWPVINHIKDAPIDAEEWKDKPNKRAILQDFVQND